MSNSIHSTAIVSPEVKLGDNIVIGPYTIIEGDVTIGDGTEIGAHCMISGSTLIGKANRIFSSASIGQDPQDKKHRRGDQTRLEIGDNNIFREFVTIHRGTLDGGEVTRIGNNNLFMAYAHAAHDCQIGSDCVLANAATLAGHVLVEDNVIVGGLVGIHQFTRVGKFAMIGGCSRVTQDVPPFSLSVGMPAAVYGINSVGLKRAKMPLSAVKNLKEAFRLVFNSGLARSTAVERIEQEIEQTAELKHLVQFIKSSERGILSGSTVGDGD